ncbi:hypothetical protein CFP65_2394 [Kitasatospora sp. MMS16-BH015]|uniref:DUF6348 family protein n=1 Tax=Kitasatospora sp. MMS16-BH015 TaxID=2018025 RepID=UPI000CA34618|nr:DUF6348 family protein [Kitasatospora sp. MMS16-BH015]AUG77228.1 hypothetical protein CFP65_2394 [Kitasatospora sp. MMS16-BH015]
MRPQQRLAVIQRSVVREMARYGQEFHVEGELVRGPGSTAVAVREHPGDGGHVDLGYVLELGRADGPVVWDCAAGLGKTEEEKLDSAVRMWATTTAPALVELAERRGEHGDHYRPGELPGWHAVQGPAAVFGFGSEELAGWLADHQVLPALAPALRPELTGAPMHGVKLFLGGRAGEDVAEVRVDGEVSEAASAALRTLPWPRGERLCWARLFVLLARDQDGEPAAPPRPTEPEPGRAVPRARRRDALGRWWQARRAGR